MTTNHLMRIASISKVFTATAVLLLESRGALGLDDPVSKYVSWVDSPRDPRVRLLTARQLLSHSAGLSANGDAADYWNLAGDFMTGGDLRTYVASTRLVVEPDTVFKYSNLGYGLLGAVVEAVSGVSYEAFVRAEIIDPLGLRRTHPDYHPTIEGPVATGFSLGLNKTGATPLPHAATNALCAATGYLSTADDVARFVASLAVGNDGVLDDHKKLEMQMPLRPIAQENAEYGLGLHVERTTGRLRVGHTGGFPGFISNCVLDVRSGVALAVLTNSTDGPAHEIAHGILHILSEYEAAEEPTADAIADLHRYEGTYYWTLGVTDIVRLGCRLVAVDPRLPEPFQIKSWLTRVGEDTFTMDTDAPGYFSLGEPVEFEFTSGGEVKLVKYAGREMRTWEQYLATLGTGPDSRGCEGSAVSLGR